MDQTTPTGSDTSILRSKERVVWVWPVCILVGIAVISSIIVLARSLRADGETQQAAAHVSITSGGLEPETISIQKGQTVLWTNQDKKPHKVVGEQSTASHFVSDEPLAQGESYGYSFETKGTYTYHDPATPEVIHGTIIVE